MIVSAYIPEWGFDGKLREGDAARLTHVNFAFALVENGLGSVSHWKNGAHIKEFNKNKGHIISILSVGGWGAGGFSNACLTKDGREKLAQSLVDIANEYGFDGIDMDWEYPGMDTAGIDASPADKDNFTDLIRLLREKQKSGAVVSMAAGALQECIDNLDLPELMKYMDFINLMTYDMSAWNKVTYHTALFPSDVEGMTGAQAADLFEKNGWPRNKMTLGAAFYARNYKEVDGLGADFPGPHPGWVHFHEAYPRGRGIEGDIQYDEKAETAYFYDPAAREFLSFDCPRSLRAKKKYARETGLAGVMFWQYYGDTADSMLLKALAE
ncbi:MAG: glycosyl hydrolase family 18 protein [Defluviitaleaceae bacterium]|nr:glycosyl hydrolase family 18 protein [Defluviitaleaceae bacterium]MCL2261961.1 glycosyl hydrolase family 18 protein [Defluviitaleaceae bacterium]